MRRLNVHFLRSEVLNSASTLRLPYQRIYSLHRRRGDSIHVLSESGSSQPCCSRAVQNPCCLPGGLTGRGSSPLPSPQLYGLECAVNLRCVYAARNMLTDCEGVQLLRNLQSLDISENRIDSVRSPG